MPDRHPISWAGFGGVAPQLIASLRQRKPLEKAAGGLAPCVRPFHKTHKPAPFSKGLISCEMSVQPARHHRSHRTLNLLAPTVKFVVHFPAHSCLTPVGGELSVRGPASQPGLFMPEPSGPPAPRTHDRAASLRTAPGACVPSQDSGAVKPTRENLPGRTLRSPACGLKP